MSYSDQRKRFNSVSVGTVVVVHAAIGYVFISGLAYQVIQHGPLVTTARMIPADPVPPLKAPPPEARPTDAPRPASVDRIVDVPLTATIDPVAIDTSPPIRPVLTDQVDPQPPVQPRMTPLLTRGAMPQGDRAGWVTSDDYPSAALREGAEGSVGIDVVIDARGRVSGCTVTASSGSDLLDQATCRLYARRARFAPALDEAGKPATTHRVDRVRWQIPR